MIKQMEFKVFLMKKKSWNKIGLSVFFDVAKCGALLSASYNQHFQNALVIAYLYKSGHRFPIS